MAKNGSRELLSDVGERLHKKSYITTTLSGPAVVTESLYEQLPSLSTTTIASEVPYISLDEFLADETTSTPSSSNNEVKQTGEFPYFIVLLLLALFLFSFARVLYKWDFCSNSFSVGIWSSFYFFSISECMNL